MILTGKDREFVSVGVSVAAGCKLCVEVHVKEARFQGVTEDEIAHSMNVGLGVRERAQRIMKQHGLRVLGRKLAHVVTGAEEHGEASEADAPGTRIDELTAVAAAFAVSCEASFEKHRAAARAAGATEEAIQESVRISGFIKGKADSLCCKRI